VTLKCNALDHCATREPKRFISKMYLMDSTGIVLFGPIIVQTQQHSCEEGTTTPLPPQEADKIWPGPSDPQKVLQLQHWEHLAWLPHHLVWQLLVIRQQGTRVLYIRPSRSLGLSSLATRTSIPGGVRGKLYNLSMTPATQVIDCSLCYKTASGTRVPSLGPKGFCIWLIWYKNMGRS
jgi:hypothetical protein